MRRYTVENKTAAGTLNTDEYANVLRQITPDMRVMFTHVECLVRLLLVNPASSATSEHHQQHPRWLKTYLRSTCNQQRLNLATYDSHKDKLDEINLNQLVAEFVAARDNRATIFGKIGSD